MFCTSAPLDCIDHARTYRLQIQKLMLARPPCMALLAARAPASSDCGAERGPSENYHQCQHDWAPCNAADGPYLLASVGYRHSLRARQASSFPPRRRRRAPAVRPTVRCRTVSQCTVHVRVDDRYVARAFLHILKYLDPSARILEF